MSDKYTRRSFIKKSAVIGAASVVGGSMLPDLLFASETSPVKVASVTGADYYKATVEAVNLLGGMNKFVSKGSKVALLPNLVHKYPATTVSHEVFLAVLTMCFDAGASEIKLIKGPKEHYWEGKKLTKEKEDIFNKTVFSTAENVVLPVKKGINLKEAHINKDVIEADVFINLPLVKNHTGTNFTGILKNLMGACPHNPTNRFFHFGAGESEDWYYNVEFLSQCIADLNTLRKPDLSIADSTEFITTNGPSGPGEIKKAQTVTAGIDPVAVDSYCTRFLNLKSSEVAMIGMAEKHGIGVADLTKVNVMEKKI